jgi:diacylglycerol O-acyltransferase-1
MRGATEWVLFVLNALNTSAALLVPCALVTRTRADIVPGFLITVSAVILWMKLVSYAHCNHDLRYWCTTLDPEDHLPRALHPHHSKCCWC